MSTVSETTVLETVLRRDRVVVVAALIAVIAAAWIWIVLGAGTGSTAVAMTQMAGMPDMDMMMERAVWTPAYAGLIFAMPTTNKQFERDPSSVLSQYAIKYKSSLRGQFYRRTLPFLRRERDAIGDAPQH